jgi:DNA-binding XRE family transcriptional regulator
MPKSPFDEEFTPEEEAALKSDAVPPAEEEGEGNVDDAIADAGKTKTEAEPAAAAPKDEPKPGAEAPAAEQPKTPTPEEETAAEEKDLAAFLEKHKGKSPKELARLAFQQTKRASKSEATNRQVNARIQAIGEQARVLAERRQKIAAEAPTKKGQFREKLASDPDAATAELYDAMVDREVSEADEAARTARMDQAIVFADEHIPEFGKQWPGMQTLAKEFGYSDQDLNQIEDGRALVMLSLANHSARLIKAGIMDRSGNIDISKIPTGEAEITDPRLNAPDPLKTLGGGGARSTAGAQTVEQQLAAINNMSDAELNAFEIANPGKIEELLQKAAA